MMDHIPSRIRSTLMVATMEHILHLNEPEVPVPTTVKSGTGIYSNSICIKASTLLQTPTMQPLAAPVSRMTFRTMRIVVNRLAAGSIVLIEVVYEAETASNLVIARPITRSVICAWIESANSVRVTAHVIPTTARQLASQLSQVPTARAMRAMEERILMSFARSAMMGVNSALLEVPMTLQIVLHAILVSRILVLDLIATV